MSKSISLTKRMLTLAKYGDRCAYCGISLNISIMHIDHVVPKKSGGSNAESNLNPSCNSCNATKGDRDLEDFRLHQMISKSPFAGVINFKQWREMNDLGVFINLPTQLFYFEDSGNEQSRN